MKTIPEIRARLVELAAELDCPELAELAQATRRRSPVRRARSRHRPLTMRQRWEIQRYAAAHPEAHQTDIAIRFGTNPGRVSEVLAGKREDGEDLG